MALLGHNKSNYAKDLPGNIHEICAFYLLYLTYDFAGLWILWLDTITDSPSRNIVSKSDIIECYFLLRIVTLWGRFSNVNLLLTNPADTNFYMGKPDKAADLISSRGWFILSRQLIGLHQIHWVTPRGYSVSGGIYVRRGLCYCY